ncbi:hypothetical protein H7X64_00590 [Armatimonadetes bacterium]|nr:hypothetical protein [bacterium]
MAEDEDANIISKVEKKKADPEKEGVSNYGKYAVGGESKEVPASAELNENNNFSQRREQSQPKQKKSRCTSKDVQVGLN